MVSHTIRYRNNNYHLVLTDSSLSRLKMYCKDYGELGEDYLIKEFMQRNRKHYAAYVKE